MTIKAMREACKKVEPDMRVRTIPGTAWKQAGIGDKYCFQAYSGGCYTDGEAWKQAFYVLLKESRVELPEGESPEEGY